MIYPNFFLIYNKLKRTQRHLHNNPVVCRKPQFDSSNSVFSRIFCRVAKNSNICFTLDAGANVHVLYPENEKEAINQFI